MSSTGQIIGGIVGAVIGTFAGNPMLGASIGMAIGGAIDPPKGPKIEGPRLNDLSQQLSTYGASIPRIYGSCAVYGNVFWIENNLLKEVKSSSEQGGKGGSSQEVTEYNYFATFALALCEGPIAGIGRIWINGKLFYNANSSDISTVLENNRISGSISEDVAEALVGSINGSGFTLYKGTEDQLPNPRMQATVGLTNTPAYRGTAYLLFEDLPLKDYGNTLVGAQIKVEVFSSTTSTIETTMYTPLYTPGNTNGGFSAQPFYIGLDCAKYGDPQWEAGYPAVSSYRIWTIYPDGSMPLGSAPIECPGSTVPPNQFSESGIFLYSPLQVFNVGGFASVTGHIYESNGIYVGNQHNGTNNMLYVSKGIPNTTLSTIIGGESATCTDGIFAYACSTAGTFKYFINWDTQSLDLVASGPGLWNMIDRASRATIDKVTGRLCTIQEAGANYLYKFSLDLNSYETLPLFESGVAMYGTATNFFVSGNITIMASSHPDVSLPYDAINNKLIYQFSVSNVVNDQRVTLSSIMGSEVSRSKLLTLSDIDVTTLTDTVAGYRIPGTGALRAGITPLQGAYPFDIIQSGYTIKFIRRGAYGSIATITENDLGSSDNNNSITKLSNSREMDLQIPWRVDISYIDYNREYDISSQYAERINTGSVNTLTLDMPIVLTADEAKQKAEILLYMYWLERNELKFNLPPTYNRIEPADIITIQKDEGTYVVRITDIEYLPNQILECVARPYTYSTYVSSAVGINGDVPIITTLSTPGAVITQLLDVPTLSDTYNTPAFFVAASGISSFWDTTYLYRSTDTGKTWDYLIGSSKPTAIGVSKNSINAPYSMGLIDSTNSLNVKFYGGAQLYSVSHLQMLNGANHFAYGIDGNWEIIAAQNCTLEADGTYSLTNLLRGRFGTEWAIEHSIYDYVILLDSKTLQLLTTSSNQINLQYLYRGVPNKANLSDQADINFAYKGVNLKPLSPVYPVGSKNPSTNDWSISWMRRTRIGGELRDNVDATLGESSELYDIEIYSGSSYNTLKRSFINNTTPSISYTSAQQVTDFGSVQTQLYIKVYQISSTIGRGYPLVTTIPYLAPTLGLAHCENLVNEVSGSSISLGGNAYITTTNAKFGTSCIYTNSAGYINFNSSNATTLYDFTFEFFSRVGLGSYPVYGNLIIQGGSVSMNGTSVITGISDGTQGYMRHVALTRKNGVVKLWANGVQIGSTGNYSTVINLSNIQVGWFGGGPLYTYQYYDEIRLSNKSLYNSEFSPPSSPFELSTGAL